MPPRPALAAAALVALALAGASAAGAAPSAPAPPAAVRAAKLHVVARHHLAGLKDVFSLRSRRDPSWALVDGFYSKPKLRQGPGLWATWLHLAGGRWLVAYSGIGPRAIGPPARLRVPCDIRPAFSEPSCQT